jgi:hypothetical protein
LSAALDWLNRVANRRCVVFVISDFLTDDPGRRLAVSARRHDLVAVVGEDPRERSLAPVGMLAIEDPETGETMLVDTSDEYVNDAFSKRRNEERAFRDRSLRSAGIDAITVTTGGDYSAALLRFFRERGRRR